MFDLKLPTLAIIFAFSALNFPVAANADTSGWFLKGDAPYNYSWGVDDQETHDGAKIAYLKFESKKVSPAGDATGFGTVMQTFESTRYRGKRMKLSGFMKTADVTVHSAFWMRADASNGKVLSFDNMSKRSVTGTTDWKNYAVVLDIPAASEEIAFGVMLSGPGEIWVSGLKFEEVDKSVPVTAEYCALDTPDHPVDLDFTAEKKR